MTALKISYESAAPELPDKTVRELWDLWDSLKPKLGGRPPSDMTCILVADAFMLTFCPHAYLHLLQDALVLRLRWISSKYRTQIERDLALAKCIKYAETASRRVWVMVHNEKPAKPPSDWWQHASHAENALRFR